MKPFCSDWLLNFFKVRFSYFFYSSRFGPPRLIFEVYIRTHYHCTFPMLKVISLRNNTLNFWNLEVWRLYFRYSFSIFWPKKDYEELFIFYFFAIFPTTGGSFYEEWIYYCNSLLFYYYSAIIIYYYSTIIIYYYSTIIIYYYSTILISYWLALLYSLL